MSYTLLHFQLLALHLHRRIELARTLHATTRAHQISNINFTVTARTALRYRHSATIPGQSLEVAVFRPLKVPSTRTAVFAQRDAHGIAQLYIHMACLELEPHVNREYVGSMKHLQALSHERSFLCKTVYDNFQAYHMKPMYSDIEEF